MAKPLKAQLKKAKEIQLKQKEEARKNTTIVKKSSGKETVVKAGTPNDHVEKQDRIGVVKFGMSKGVTKNMDNYESLRVDVWLSDEVQPGEGIYEAYSRVEEIINEILEESVFSTVGE